MTENYPMPDPEKVKQSVAKLRQACLELEEINARLEANIHQQRLKRL